MHRLIAAKLSRAVRPAAAVAGRARPAAVVVDPLEHRRLMAATARTLATFTAGASFDTNPYGTGIARVGGDLYTTDRLGGTSGAGVLLKLPAGTGTVVPAPLVGSRSPAYPVGPITTDAAGNLYVTGYLAVGRYQPATGRFPQLTSGSGLTLFGSGATVDAAGDVYVATHAGQGQVGIVRVRPGTRQATPVSTTTIATVPYDDDGSGYANLSRPVFDAAGNLYGTVDGFDPAHPGLVYRVAAGTGAVTVLHRFAADGSDGQSPGGLTVDSVGNVFGFTFGGGTTGSGTVYELAGPNHTFTTLASLTPATGGGIIASAEPIVDGAGNVYGTTALAGPDAGDQGTVFVVPAGTSQVKVLAAFAPGGATAAPTVPTLTGAYPSTGLFMDPATGHLFGATFGDATAAVPASLYEVDGALPPLTIATPGPQSAVAKATETFDLGSFLAADGAVGPYTVSVDWGDGTAPTTFRQAAAGPLPTRTHAYAAAGSDRATVTVTDAAGHTSNRAKFTVTVTAKPTAGVAGVVYEDRSGNGLLPDPDPANGNAVVDDAPLAGVTVALYRDANANGKVDAADPLVAKAKSGPAGAYAFAAVASGSYLVAETVPAGYVRTAPDLSGAYAVTVRAGRQASVGGFDNYRKPTGPLFGSVVYSVNGVAVPTLRGHTFAGATVTVTVTAGYAGETFTFVTYSAPSAKFSADTAAQQVRGGYVQTTVTVAGASSTFTVDLPTTGHYQLDLIVGLPIDQFGPAGSNRFYSAQGRLIDADNE